MPWASGENCIRNQPAGFEMDPPYVDVSVRRRQTCTGQAATMAITGETFAEIEHAAPTLCSRADRGDRDFSGRRSD